MKAELKEHHHAIKAEISRIEHLIQDAEPLDEATDKRLDKGVMLIKLGCKWLRRAYKKSG